MTLVCFSSSHSPHTWFDTKVYFCGGPFKIPSKSLDAVIGYSSFQSARILYPNFDCFLPALKSALLNPPSLGTSLGAFPQEMRATNLIAEIGAVV